MNQKHQIIRKIFRSSDIEKLQQKINMLGNDVKFDAVSFINMRLATTFIIFIIILSIFDLGYIFAPFGAIAYYYLYYYLMIESPLKKRIKKLDYEALHFFEILTLTLESGRNLENSLEVTCFNVDSELSNEFKKALFELKFGKSLLEALEDLKKRMPSEIINNIILNITQTNLFGNSILETMYNQIDFLRDKQILSIKEQINKIPNKVSIVSVLFVVPLILIMILGPIVINFLR
jgi:tight adherence protein C